MEDPRTELEPAVNAFLLRIFAGTQDIAIETFFTPDAGLIHPLCFIPRSRGSDHGTRSPYMQCSRDRIKTVYRWYREITPNLGTEIGSFAYDDKNHVAYFHLTQIFRMFISPFKEIPIRLVVKLSLEKSRLDGKYYICQQEDFYQPEDILQLTLPFLVPLFVRLKYLVVGPIEPKKTLSLFSPFRLLSSVVALIWALACFLALILGWICQRMHSLKESFGGSSGNKGDVQGKGISTTIKANRIDISIRGLQIETPGASVSFGRRK